MRKCKFRLSVMSSPFDSIQGHGKQQGRWAYHGVFSFFEALAKKHTIRIIFFSVLLLVSSNRLIAQYRLFDYKEIESGCKFISKYHDSITFVRQYPLVPVYYIEFKVLENCDKSYRIFPLKFLTEVISKPSNYYVSIYNRYFLFYDADTINFYRVERIDSAFREKLKILVIDDIKESWTGEVGMGCVYNSCSTNKLFLAPPPGSRRILRNKSADE